MAERSYPIFWGCSTSSYKYFRNQATPNTQQTYNKYPSEPVLYFDIISRVQRICSCLIHGLFFLYVLLIFFPQFIQRCTEYLYGLNIYAFFIHFVGLSFIHHKRHSANCSEYTNFNRKLGNHPATPSLHENP